MNQKEKKFAWIFGIIIIVLVSLTIAFAPKDPNKNYVCLGMKCFEVEIADTPQEREIGLMNRASLPETRGMLFIFEQEDMHTFWMKNTLIPLDIIWINSNKEVVYIQKNARPCETQGCTVYTPDKNSLYVLELNAGTADRIDLINGKVLVFSLA